MRDKLKKLTLEQKAKLTVGGGKWSTCAIPEEDIPALIMCDGPNGVRRENEHSEKSDQFNEFNSFPATCIPTSSALASSWDREVCRRAGEVMGKQAREFGVNVLLCPGVNHKRIPIGGRNFEYFSEDPCLTGRLAGQFIDGLQGQGVGCSLKHFYANNTEHNRLTVDVRMNERAKREIYLAAFEYIVKHHAPATVMAAYNRVEGDFCTENFHNLTEILRGEWGFDGVITSDWWATHDTVKRLNAGCNLEMPYVSDRSCEKIIEAVKNGELSEDRLDEMADGVLGLIDRLYRDEPVSNAPDLDEGHRAAVSLAEKCVVLLKNDGCLPLGNNFCYIGLQAKEPSYQGAGSSRVNTSLAQGILAATERLTGGNVAYCDGYGYEREDERLILEACALAAAHETAVVFLGLGLDVECESEDRKDIALLPWQNELVMRVSAVNPRTVVVLTTGAPVSMPWAEQAGAIIQAGLLGEGVGEAVSSVLFGKTNPSGRLVETYPCTLDESPAYRYYRNSDEIMYYNEGLLTGYRYYTTKNVRPLFPFGFGLSYTNFEYEDLAITVVGDTVTAETTVRNTGERDGEEVVQLYVSVPESTIFRPSRELKGFEKVFVRKGECVRVAIRLWIGELAYFDETESQWKVESGRYVFSIARDSMTPVLSAEQVISVKSETVEKETENESR